MLTILSCVDEFGVGVRIHQLPVARELYRVCAIKILLHVTVWLATYSNVWTIELHVTVWLATYSNVWTIVRILNNSNCRTPEHRTAIKQCVGSIICVMTL